MDKLSIADLVALRSYLIDDLSERQTHVFSILQANRPEPQKALEDREKLLKKAKGEIEKRISTL